MNGRVQSLRGECCDFRRRLLLLAATLLTASAVAAGQDAARVLTPQTAHAQLAARLVDSDAPDDGGIASGQPPANDSCFTAQQITCGVVLADLTKATIDPGDPALTCFPGTPGPGVANVWFSFIAASSGDYMVRTCGTSFAGADSVIALYAGFCGNLFEICCNDDACGASNLLSSFCCPNLIAGEQYYIQVNCTSNAARGVYYLELLCDCESGGGGQNPCPWTCPAGAIVESEPNCGLPSDTTNGGCNSATPVYNSIGCGDTVCGTYGADSGTRDSDWYEFCLSGAMQVTVTAVGDAGTVVALVELPTGCSAPVIHQIVQAPMCEEVTLTACLSEGCYYVVILPDVFFGLTCGTRYKFTLSCTPVQTGACCVQGNCIDSISECECADLNGVFYAGTTCTQLDGRCGCDVICEGDVTRYENEPGCGIPVDTTNGGCTTSPPHFALIDCGDRLCGTYGAIGGLRDVDAYLLSISGTQSVTVSVFGDLPTFLTLTGWPASGVACDDIPDVPLFATTQYPCQSAVITATLNTGLYVVAVTPGLAITNVGCPHDYILTVNCQEQVVVGGDTNCDGTIDFFDIDFFLLALFNPAGYTAANPNCDIRSADMNGDGVVDFFDIDAFLDCLFNGDCG